MSMLHRPGVVPEAEPVVPADVVARQHVRVGQHLVAESSGTQVAVVSDERLDEDVDRAAARQAEIAGKIGIQVVRQKRGTAAGLGVWREPLVSLRVPKLYNLRSDPFERGDVDGSMFYDKWMVDRAFLLVPAQAVIGEFLKTFEEFPPRQKPASFSIDGALEKARQSEKQLAIANGGGVK